MCAVLCLVTQSCQTLCGSMEYNLPGASVNGGSGFSRQEYWSIQVFKYSACLPAVDLPITGIKPRSPATRVDSLPSEPPGKTWNSLCFIKNISLIPVLTILTFLSTYFQEFIFFCLMFKLFCSNNLNLLKVLQKLVYILHFPIN